MFKPFRVLSVNRDYTESGAGDKLHGYFPAIATRRVGITVSVLPTEKNGKVCWEYSIEQKGAKLTKNGYKFSNYSRQSKNGSTNTFEEAQKIVTETYKKWMEASK